MFSSLSWFISLSFSFWYYIIMGRNFFIFCLCSFNSFLIFSFSIINMLFLLCYSTSYCYNFSPSSRVSYSSSSYLCENMLFSDLSKSLSKLFFEPKKLFEGSISLFTGIFFADIYFYIGCRGFNFSRFAKLKPVYFYVWDRKSSFWPSKFCIIFFNCL